MEKNGEKLGKQKNTEQKGKTAPNVPGFDIDDFMLFQ